MASVQMSWHLVAAHCLLLLFYINAMSVMSTYGDIKRSDNSITGIIVLLLTGEAYSAGKGAR